LNRRPPARFKAWRTRRESESNRTLMIVGHADQHCGDSLFFREIKSRPMKKNLRAPAAGPDNLYILPSETQAASQSFQHGFFGGETGGIAGKPAVFRVAVTPLRRREHSFQKPAAAALGSPLYPFNLDYIGSHSGNSGSDEPIAQIIHRTSWQT